MLPENSDSAMPDGVPELAEFEPIAPSAADTILRAAMQPYTEQGWHVVDQGPFNARLTRGSRNLDLRVDLTGQLEAHETGLTPLQESGRLTAWLVLLAMLLVALALAAALGLL